MAKDLDHDKLYALARHYVREALDGCHGRPEGVDFEPEDVVAEVVVEFWKQHVDAGHPDPPAFGLLKTIARTTVIDRVRRAAVRDKGRDLLVQIATGMGPADPAEIAAHLDEVAYLLTELPASLDESDRRVWEYCLDRGDSGAEVTAAELGMSKATFYRARQKILILMRCRRQVQGYLGDVQAKVASFARFPCPERAEALVSGLCPEWRPYARIMMGREVFESLMFPESPTFGRFPFAAVEQFCDRQFRLAAQGAGGLELARALEEQAELGVWSAALRGGRAEQRRACARYAEAVDELVGRGFVQPYAHVAAGWWLKTRALHESGGLVLAGLLRVYERRGLDEEASSARGLLRG
jgi:DNA-directed RNA polymerase specialized sigma24 family protein